MKKIKTFEKFNKLNEHAWQQDMNQLANIIEDGKDVLFICSTIVDPDEDADDVLEVSIPEVVKMSKSFDVVIIDDYLFIGGRGGLKPIYVNRMTIVKVDKVKDLPKLPNHIELDTVGYDL